MTLSTTGHFGMRIFAVLLAVMAILTYMVVNSLNDSYKWLTHTHEVIENIHESVTLIAECQNASRGYILTKDPNFLSAYNEYHNEILPQVDRLGVLVSDNPEQVKNVSEFREEANQMVNKMRRAVGYGDNGEFDRAVQFVAEGSGEIVMSRLQIVMNKMLDVERRLLIKRTESVLKCYKYASYGMPALVFISAIVLMLIRGTSHV
jgi:CHASE3 domain sensor protein